jgi:hypothetical protein
MDDPWRIPFTVCIAIPLGLAVCAGLVIGWPVVWFLATWLFCGVLIGGICGPMPLKVFCKLVVFWLFALWSGRIQDWVMNE